jgi:hypothetical protein
MQREPRWEHDLMSEPEERMTARELWERLVAMPTQDAQDDWLEVHELRVAGEWRSIVMADVLRSPNSPLLLYTDWPDGEHRVPMDEEIPIRPLGERHG